MNIQLGLLLKKIDVMSGNKKGWRKDILEEESMQRIYTSDVPKYFKQMEGQNKYSVKLS